MIINVGGQNNVVRISNSVIDSYYLDQIRFLKDYNNQLLKIIDSQRVVIGEQMKKVNSINQNKRISDECKNKKK